MNFKENILKSVMKSFLLISFFTTIGSSQSLIFTYVDSVFQYTEEIQGSHLIQFLDSTHYDSTNFLFEYSGNDTTWLNVSDTVFGNNGEFNIQFSGTPDDENLNDTLFTLIVTNDITDESDTLDFNVNIISVNDAPEIFGQNLLLYLRNSLPFPILKEDLYIIDSDNTIDQMSVEILAGQNYTWMGGDTIIVDQDFTGILTVNVQVNDGELENNLSNVFPVIIDIAMVPDFFDYSTLDSVWVTEEEDFSMNLAFYDWDTLVVQNYSFELIGSATNWIDYDNNLTYDEHLTWPSYNFSLSGIPDDIHLNDTLLTIVVSDNYELSDTIDVHFYIIPINDAPEIVGQNPKDVDEDTAFQIFISDLNIYDPANENDSFELILFEGENYTFDASNWIQLDSNFFGNLSVNIQVTDGDTINELSNTFEFSVDINPINDNPVFLPNEMDTLYSIEENELEFEIKFLDPDEKLPATFIVISRDESSEWYRESLFITKNADEYTIHFTGTPDDIDLHETSVEIEIVDEFGLTDQAGLNIQIESVNDANPEIITIPEEVQIINEDFNNSIIIEFIDLDNHSTDVMSVEISGSATNWTSFDDNLTFVNEVYQFSISGSPDDIHYEDNFMTIKITDYDLGFVEDTIRFHILSVNDSAVEFETDSEDLDAAFGAIEYSTTIAFEDIDNHDIYDYHIDISNVLFNGETADGLLEIGELNYSDGEYYFSVFATFEENLEMKLCEFDISVTDEVFFMNEEPVSGENDSTTVTKHFVLPVLPNSSPVPIITLSDSSGTAGSQINLNSDDSFDINSDIQSYLWSVQPIIRKETYIDLNQNGEFDSNEPFQDINYNGIFDVDFEQEIYTDIENVSSSSTILTIPETFEDTDIVVELTIMDNKGASGKTEEIVYSINPKLVLNSVVGNQNETAVMPIQIDYLPNTPIYSLDLEFRWNLEQFELDDEFECSSMSHYPPVIGDSISISLTELLENFQYQINDMEAGKLGVTVFSVNGDSLNSIMTTGPSFAELNIPLTGFHSESDRIYVSKFDINESTFGFNSNFDSQNGQVSILDDKISPIAGFMVWDIDGTLITENDFIYSGSELEFEIITICEDENIPVADCDSTGHNLLGNGLNPQYSWDFDNDGNIDESGPLYGNIINEFTFSISGFDNVVKTAVLYVETAYGCATNEFNIDIEPLIPTIRMSRSGDGFDYDGEPASINLFINQMEDLEALDLVLNYDPTFISIIDVESQINSSIPLNQASHYSLFHNTINSQVIITAFSDSTDNYTFFSENSDFQFASLKFYALQPGNTDISIISFDVEEESFLNNIGEDALLTIENVNPNEEGQYDCNINGEYNQGEDFTDSNENGVYDEGEDFVDVGDLNGSAIIDQCGICSGGMTNLIPNETQDCQGTCMPSGLLQNIDVEIFADSVYVNGQNYGLSCEENYEGFNIESLECELYIGLGSLHPLSGENGIDRCGICGGNNILLDGQFIGSNIDCNGFCSENTPNASDQYGFCGCADDADGLYPDIYGYCKNDEEPVPETGLCADIFDDIDMNGIWNLGGGDLIIQKIDTTTTEFSNWGYKYLNYDPIAMNNDGSCSRGVVINEFFFSPIQGTAVPDYIELLNMTPFDLDITSWSINGIEIEEVYDGTTPIMPAGKHFLISTGSPFYNLEGELFFPGNCDDTEDNCIPNSLALNINLGMNNGEILIQDFTTMDYLNYTEEAYWPVGATFTGHSVELIEPYKNRNLSSNWMSASEYFPNPYMATEDGEWNVAGGYNYGTPSNSNNAYNINHSENCNEILNVECNLTKYDCDDVFNGLAFYDLCGICAGGSTQNQPSIFDESLGMCIGNSNIIDCACTCYTEPNFEAVVDDCGQCTLGNAGSFDTYGNIVSEIITHLDCVTDDDCTIWGMVCNDDTDYCHHMFEGQKDICGTCRSGPICDGTNNEICDEYYNIPEVYTDENQNGLYDIGEPFTDLNGDEIRNDGIDGCGVCTENAINVYSDSNEDGQTSPCFDGEFDEYGNWISNCPDWESAVDIIGCPVDCLGDVNIDGISDDVLADLDECGECIACSTEDCFAEEDWNNLCVYDFDAMTDMNIPGIQLNWTPHLDYDYYQIYKDGQLFADSLLATESVLIDVEVYYPNTYCYYIKAYNDNGDFSNPSPDQCASIDYFGFIQFGEFQISENLNSVGINVDVSDQMDAISIQITENVIVDTLINGLFENDWYRTERDGNNIIIYPNNPNSSLDGFMELGDVVFTRDTTTLDNSFCITGANLDPHYEILYPNGFIAQLPDCEYFGCTIPEAFNYNENASVEDGSCNLPFYSLDIEPTDNSQNITISSTIEELEIGDEIAIFDANGILSTECPSEYGELLVGTSQFQGESITISAIRATPCSPFNPNVPAEPGFYPGNEIIVKVWRNSIQTEMVFSVSEQGHLFSGTDITIDELNIPLYYQLEIEETGNFQSIIFSENSGLEYGDHIGIYDYAGITSTECPAQFGTLLVGSGYYENESLTIDAIRANPCSPFNQNLPAEPGFVVNNEIIIKIWRSSEQMEYISEPSELYLFGTQEIFIDDILNTHIVDIPYDYQLHPVFPNPFNPVATIQYDVPEITNISIEVFNVLGKRVSVLYNGNQHPGMHKVQWDGSGQSSGLYLIRMSSPNVNFTEKVMLVK